MSTYQKTFDFLEFVSRRKQQQVVITDEEIAHAKQTLDLDNHPRFIALMKSLREKVMEEGMDAKEQDDVNESNSKRKAWNALIKEWESEVKAANDLLIKANQLKQDK